MALKRHFMTYLMTYRLMGFSGDSGGDYRLNGQWFFRPEG